MRARRATPAVATGLLVLAGQTVWLATGWGGDRVVRVMDDLVQLGLAGLGAAWCLLAARAVRRSADDASGAASEVIPAATSYAAADADRHERLGWRALGLGLVAWTAGQAIWTWYQVVLGVDTPFPSLADLGYLLFPVGCAVGLVRLARASGLLGATTARVTVDGVLVAGSLFVLSWSTALGAVFHAGGENLLATVVSLGYPASDIVIGTVALLSATRRSSRTPVVLVSAAFLMGAADSAFAYLNAVGEYGSSNVTDVGWSAAFLLFARAGARRRAARRVDVRAAPQPAPVGRQALWPPYVPLAVAVIVVVHRVFSRLGPDVVVISAGLLIAILLLRQLLALADNRRLVEDVAAREQQLQHQAFHDPLTGLANRALFISRLRDAVARHRTSRQPLALLYLDLDDFKVVNDSHGHHAGDALLVAVADRLRATLRTEDTVARLGGDEFAVLVEQGADAWADLGHRLVEAFAGTFDVDGRALSARPSIGVVPVPAGDGPFSAEDLLLRGDVAMYAAKRADEPLAVFEVGMHASYLEERTLRHDLADAVRDRTIYAAYQPVVDVATGAVVGVEALARWDHPEHGAVRPDRFVPLAEQAGLIRELGLGVLDLALGDLTRWDATGTRLRLAVNISAHQLIDPAFPGQVARLLGHHKVKPTRLILEITEGALVSNVAQAVAVARDLAAAGVDLALDDFGVGYSSLAHLAGFPLHELKIDRSFVEPLGTEPEHTVFVAAVVQLAHSLGLTSIAEGVERPEQLDLLRAVGCDQVQGWLTGRPTTAAAIHQLLASSRDEHREALPSPRAWHTSAGSSPAGSAPA